MLSFLLLHTIDTPTFAYKNFPIRLIILTRFPHSTHVPSSHTPRMMHTFFHSICSRAYTIQSDSSITISLQEKSRLRRPIYTIQQHRPPATTEEVHAPPASATSQAVSSSFSSSTYPLRQLYIHEYPSDNHSITNIPIYTRNIHKAKERCYFTFPSGKKANLLYKIRAKPSSTYKSTPHSNLESKQEEKNSPPK